MRWELGVGLRAHPLLFKRPVRLCEAQLGAEVAKQLAQRHVTSALLQYMEKCLECQFVSYCNCRIASIG